jgi:hypothetical protein
MFVELINLLYHHAAVTILSNAADAKHRGACLRPTVKELHTSKTPFTVFLNTTTNGSSIFLFCSNLLLYWTVRSSVSVFLLPSLSLFISFYVTLSPQPATYTLHPSLSFSLLLTIYTLSSFIFVFLFRLAFFFEILFILIFLSAS